MVANSVFIFSTASLSGPAPFFSLIFLPDPISAMFVVAYWQFYIQVSCMLKYFPVAKAWFFFCWELVGFCVIGRAF